MFTKIKYKKYWRKTSLKQKGDGDLFLNLIKQKEITGIFRKTTLSSYHKLVLLVDKRSDLQKHLESNGIETKIHYKRTLDSNNIGRYPNAERLCNHAISLPIYPFLKKEEVEYICKTIKAFYGI